MDETPRISIVDDDVSIRRALGRLCKSAGYSVDAYESAEAFLNSSNSDRTNCLILDLHLPGRSGLELQNDLSVANWRVPIVFMTADEDEQVRATALAAGAVDFLRKPLDCDRLLDVIHSALAAHKFE